MGKNGAFGVVEVGPIFEGGEGAGGGGLLGEISLGLCFLRSEVGGMGGDLVRERLGFWGKGLEDHRVGLRGSCSHWWGVARSGGVVWARGVHAWD